MAVGLVTGDVSMTAIGTVTAALGDRVYGFGHPFFQLGECEFPLLSAYVHAGDSTLDGQLESGLGTSTPVGKIDADVSTCVAGWLNRSADTIPLTIRLRSGHSALDQTFRCHIVRERTLLGPLTMSTLGSCATLEGDAPDDLTVKFSAKVELDGYPPLQIEDVFSGARYSGTRGLLAVYSPLANLLTALSNNPFRQIHVTSISSNSELINRRSSADVIAAWAVHPVLEAGETLEVIARLQPYQRGQGSEPQAAKVVERRMSLQLPNDLPPGKYSARIGDAPTDFRAVLSDRPHLQQPRDFQQLYRFLAAQLDLRRTDLVLRFTPPALGVAVNGTELPNLPAGIVDILSRDDSRKVTPLKSSVVARLATEWAIEDSQRVQFEVVKEKRFFPRDQ